MPDGSDHGRELLDKSNLSLDELKADKPKEGKEGLRRQAWKLLAQILQLLQLLIRHADGLPLLELLKKVVHESLRRTSTMDEKAIQAQLRNTEAKRARIQAALQEKPKKQSIKMRRIRSFQKTMRRRRIWRTQLQEGTHPQLDHIRTTHGEGGRRGEHHVLQWGLARITQ